MKKILIAAGGTGGHVFPAIAIADELKNRGFEVCWVGSKDRMEATLVPKHGYNIEFIQISGLRGSGLKGLITLPFRLTRAILQARKIIKNYKPDVILGMGGYVSGPVGLAAKICKIPLVLHEQNAVLGMTNKYLAKIASKTMAGYPNVIKNAEVVGNPLRKALVDKFEQAKVIKNDGEKLNLLVVGGSQGAYVLNHNLAQAYPKLAPNFNIKHQVGKNNLAKVSAEYQDNAKDVDITKLISSNTNLQLCEFIDDMDSAYSWADIIICRSGALTVGEVALMGVPAIFVPFEHKDRQQYLNADYLANQEAAIIVEQNQLNPSLIVDKLLSLDYSKRCFMSNKAKQMATPKATLLVSQAIEDLIEK